jgi:hypothetical protein
MNRGTVVLLALAILLAHTFAIHQTPEGDFGEPYEIAHVSYRLGRNLVYEGTALWNPDGRSAAESYPSTSWVLLAALAARLYLSPILFAQVVGLVSVLGTAIVLAQFSPKRTAGLIAPLLLAASGSAAASALSGTEASLAMFLTTLAFLAFERGWARILSGALALLLLTRPEGLCTLALLGAGEFAWRPRGEHAPRRALAGAYVLPLALVAGAALLRRVFTGSWVSPFAAPLLEPDPERWNLGLHYLASFAVSSGFGLLFLVVILSLAAGRTRSTGGRALALAGAWWSVVVLSGGDGLPFWNALVPVLPLFFLGVQECLRAWMDERAGVARVAWPILLASVLASFAVSKVPGNVGPLPLAEPLTRWQTPHAELARAYPRPLGRLGLLEEIRGVKLLRTLGVFLRDRVGADASILTAWPGTIGYLSRKEVFDLAGRVWPLPGEGRPHSWRGVKRFDVVATLPDVDYIVPVIGSTSEIDAPSDLLGAWLAMYDVVGATPEREGELLSSLGDYHLISVPVPAESRRPHEPSERPFPLLERKSLELTPSLELEIEGQVLRVLLRHEGHQQVVDLCVRARRGRDDLYLRPTGGWTSDGPLDARTSVLVFPTGTRAILLIEARVPPELAGARVSAWLHNPGMLPDAPLAPVGHAVRAPVEPR